MYQCQNITDVRKHHRQPQISSQKWEGGRAMILPDIRQFTKHRIITHLYQGKARIIGVFRFTSGCRTGSFIANFNDTPLHNQNERDTNIKLGKSYYLKIKPPQHISLLSLSSSCST